MNIVQQTFPYEILVRLGLGGYQAAHVIELERVIDLDSGHIFMERELPARPITVENAGAILGAANVQLLTQLDAMRIRAETAEAALAAALEAAALHAAAPAMADAEPPAEEPA